MNYVDPDGKKVVIWYGPKGNEKSFSFSGFHGKNSIRVPNDAFVKSVIQAYVYNCINGGGEAFKRAVNRKEKIYVDDARLYDGDNSFSNDGHQPTVYWNPEIGIRFSERGSQSPATILEHEMDHAVDYVDNAQQHNERSRTYDKQFDTKEERRVITGNEAKTAKSNGEAVRFDHRGTLYQTVSPITIEEQK